MTVKCGAYYGTGQQPPQPQTATCERDAGHPAASEDGIGCWGEGDHRYGENPDGYRLTDVVATLRRDNNRMASLIGQLKAALEEDPVNEVLVRLVSNPDDPAIVLDWAAARLKKTEAAEGEAAGLTRAVCEIEGLAEQVRSRKIRLPKGAKA